MIVLIVAKCNVNTTLTASSSLGSTVLIVAKCNVNATMVVSRDALEKY